MSPAAVVCLLPLLLLTGVMVWLVVWMRRPE